MTAPALTHQTLRHGLRLEADEEERAALWAMSPEQRVAAMWASQLTHGQLLAWTRARPNEIPLLAGEFAWLVMLTPDWADAYETHHDNVVRLPERSQARAAA